MKSSRLSGVLMALVAACGQQGAAGAPVADAGRGDVDRTDARADGPTDDADVETSPDGPAAEASSPDATPDSPAAACNPNAPFGAPVLLAGDNLNTTNEEGGPRLTADELTIYFSSRRLYPDSGNASGLFVAHRSSRTAAFDAPVPLLTLDPPGGQGDFEPTTNTDLTLYFASDRAGGLGAKDIWVASRASVTNDFDPPTDLAAPINSPSEDATPFLTADGSELWFSSGRPGGLGGQDIYRATWAGSSFAAPELATEISSPVDDYSPTLSADGLVIFFTSNRTDGAVLGSYDIWTASRARVTDPFSNAHPLPILNSPVWDFVGWLSRDGCRLYMSSTRPGVGREDLYIATRGM
jgi:hypothetical protein